MTGMSQRCAGFVVCQAAVTDGFYDVAIPGMGTCVEHRARAPVSVNTMLGQRGSRLD